MNKFLALLLIAATASISHAADSQESDRRTELPRSAPEAQGVASHGILEFVDAADKIDYMNSFMLLRHGHVVAEGWWAPYRANAPHMLYSLSKSFTSTAVGLAISEGKLSLDDPVLKFFPDDAPKNPSENLKSMRVRDLLRMQAGQVSEPGRTDAEPWTKSFLAQPVPFKPGTHFLYNTSGTYMLSAIVQKATGQTVRDYLIPRLFEPLGIGHPTWETSPQGISAGGFGLNIRTEDIARFGQLYLQHGKWEGKQLVPESWVAAATTLQTSNGSNPKSDWDQGYCYQFWRCRHDAFRGDGAFGQYCIVMPKQDAVLAITSGVSNMQAVLDLVWDKLLPAMSDSPLPADDAAQSALRNRLKHLTLWPQQGAAATADVFGKEFVFPANDQHLESIRLEKSAAGGAGDAVTIVARVDGKEHSLTCGHDAWLDGESAWGLWHGSTAASGAWTADGVYSAKLCCYKTPFIVTLGLQFAADELRLTSRMNLGFGPTQSKSLTAKLKADK